jgi:hypothetical protein
LQWHQVDTVLYDRSGISCILLEEPINLPVLFSWNDFDGVKILRKIQKSGLQFTNVIIILFQATSKSILPVSGSTLFFLDGKTWNNQ